MYVTCRIGMCLDLNLHLLCFPLLWIVNPVRGHFGATTNHDPF